MLIFATLAFSADFYSGINRKVFFAKHKGRHIRTNSDEWHFIRFDEIPNLKELKENGINIHKSDLVSPHWFRSFLNDYQVHLLETNYGAKVADILPQDKIFGNPPKSEVCTLIFNAHKNFNPQDPLLRGMNISKYTKTYYHATVNNGEAAAKKLSQLSTVSSIESVIIGEDLMLRHCAGFTQRNSGPSIVDETWKTARYLNQKGLTGKNVTALITDTGVDFYSTYFYRANETFEYVLPDYSAYQPSKHSKIAMYDGAFGRKDTNGHGTQTASIFAGKAASGNKLDELYNGIAYDARIAVLHLDNAGVGYEPKPLVMSYLTNASRSRISSNSFGRQLGSTLHDRNKQFGYDEAAYYNQNITYFFAAGNSGPRENSMANYASGKNVLAVASSQIASSETYYAYKMPYCELVCGNQTFRAPINTYYISFYPTLDPTVSGVLKRITDQFTNDDIVIIDGDYEENIKKAAKKCRAVIYTGMDEHSLTLQTGSDVPIFCVEADISSLIGKNVTVRPAVDPALPKIKISGTSSRGISNDGIKKPDITTVGENVYSAFFDASYSNKGHNTRAISSGTSMATPLAAGSAALILDYFYQARFMNKSQEISSNTVKALLIASGDSIVGGDFNTAVAHEGHGQINLINILNVDNEEGKRLGLAEDVSINTSDHLVATVKVQSQSDIRIGMAYADKVLNVESLPKLASDVTLYVESPSGKKYWGNGEEERASTLERVFIKSSESEVGDYKLHLVCSSLFEDLPVNTSVVFVGAIGADQKITFSKVEDTCISNCSGNGECDKGICKCKAGFWGSACQYGSIRIEYDYPEFWLEHASLEPKLYEIKIREEATKVDVTVISDFLGPRNSQIFLTKNRSNFFWAVDQIIVFDVDDIIFHEYITVYPNEQLNTKPGDTVYMTVYNLNAKPHQFAVSVNYTFSKDPPRSPTPLPTTPPATPFPTMSPLPTKSPSVSPKPPSSPEPTASPSASIPAPTPSNSYAATQSLHPSSTPHPTEVVPSVAPPSESQGGAESSSSNAEYSSSGHDDHAQGGGSISQGGVIAISIVVPIVIIAIVAVGAYFFITYWRHRNYMKETSDIDVDSDDDI